MTPDADARATAIIASSLPARVVTALLDVMAAAWARSWTRGVATGPDRRRFWAVVIATAVLVVVLGSWIGPAGL